ncbi:hypothetical protein [Variovorax guangxiensis]|uniref:DNA-binding transcriptional regulator YdaS (Cro superfamily) n=1 Tax=Variovorax guangxiensis TaxID=1775474 RepID=A0A840G8P3_9BURK|nr:hypothetical protein [Variovorax guangxiensis]MBB4225601.1 DNA-binding transcriptional regulator YdaS (Cro superfamily) [Variovorax guangxiensis]
MLIDKAKEISGSDYKLAKLTGHTPQQISDWRHGRKPCPPEDQALIAGVAGLNAEQVALRALVEKHEGTAKGDRLMKVLGKALLATGGAIASAGASAAAISSTIHTVPSLATAAEWLVGIYTMCIMLNNRAPINCASAQKVQK